ncbi:hypothetical protein BDB00DRAFT_545621 [Zychaea mexicana]|uniref:uncharacterized protein n=1 Tax=Zychaea mexicana TaxID=64656 RepID=UPI0022FDCB01|nr:uncharacterized protein BDB00DRAFT_545621 [Zychaea mexicana]KAI9497909.1 hypothetical protein BDB00DRAFT_545621 [Zychaea mexicana]
MVAFKSCSMTQTYSFAVSRWEKIYASPFCICRTTCFNFPNELIHEHALATIAIRSGHRCRFQDADNSKAIRSGARSYGKPLSILIT